MNDTHDEVIVTDGPVEKFAFNVGQAAAAAGVSKSAVYHAIARGQVPSRRVLGRVVILREDWLRVVRG